MWRENFNIIIDVGKLPVLGISELSTISELPFSQHQQLCQQVTVMPSLPSPAAGWACQGQACRQGQDRRAKT
jgi:hypothetical protein